MRKGSLPAPRPSTCTAKPLKPRCAGQWQRPRAAEEVPQGQGKDKRPLRKEVAPQKAAPPSKDPQEREGKPMRRILSTLCGLAFIFCGLTSSAGAASLGLSEFDLTFTGPNGERMTRAGAHPFAMTTSLKFNTEESSEGTFPAESAKDLLVSLASGFAG